MALSCERVGVRRLLVLLVAVLLCTAGWARAGSADARADEVTALAGPSLPFRTSAEVDAPPPTPHDALVGWIRLSGPSASADAQGRRPASRTCPLACNRKGDPGAARGPPSHVVS